MCVPFKKTTVPLTPAGVQPDCGSLIDILEGGSYIAFRRPKGPTLAQWVIEEGRLRLQVWAGDAQEKTHDIDMGAA